MPPSRFIACLCVVAAVCARAQPAETYLQKMRTVHSAEDFGRMTGGKVRIEKGLDREKLAALRETVIRWPTTSFTVLAVQSPDVTWVGTREGAVRLSRNNAAVEYFAGRRWLPDDHVTGIGFEGEATWVETAKGF